MINAASMLNIVSDYLGLASHQHGHTKKHSILVMIYHQSQSYGIKKVGFQLKFHPHTSVSLGTSSTVERGDSKTHNTLQVGSA